MYPISKLNAHVKIFNESVGGCWQHVLSGEGAYRKMHMILKLVFKSHLQLKQ